MTVLQKTCVQPEQVTRRHERQQLEPADDGFFRTAGRVPPVRGTSRSTTAILAYTSTRRRTAARTIDGVTTFPGRGHCGVAGKRQAEEAVMLARAKLYPGSRVMEHIAASDAPIMSSVLSSTVTRQVFPQAGQ
jgi:hypothetical protein